MIIDPIKMILWFIFARKKVILIKDGVMKLESFPKRNFMTVFIIKFIWELKSDRNEAVIVDG